jgi:hypothetical protein
MNVEGDFRYCDPGGFDECVRFLDYLDECDGNWDNAFLNWINVCERRKKEYGALPNGDWRPWDFVKVNVESDGEISGIGVRSLLSPSLYLFCSFTI